MKSQFSALNKPLIAALAVCAALNGAAAHAAGEQKFTIDLEATIPSDAFQIVPVTAGWISQTQDMGYDIATKKLQVFEKQFQFKNTSGGIRAALTGNLNTSGQPQLSNGTDVIPLAVKFNGVALSKTATTVVTAGAAKTGGRTTLKISQADDKSLTVNGSFTGSVSMTFEPVVAAR